MYVYVSMSKHAGTEKYQRSTEREVLGHYWVGYGWWEEETAKEKGEEKY